MKNSVLRLFAVLGICFVIAISYFPTFNFSSVLANDLEEIEVFPDVDVNHPNWVAIHTLRSMGVFQGYPDGTFGPGTTLNRAELLTILVRPILNDQEWETAVFQGLYRDCFEDVGNEWFAFYVCFAKDSGWVSGYSDGTFRPDEAVNRAEAMKMLLEVYDFDLVSANSKPYEDVGVDQWYSEYVFSAKKYGILDPSLDFYFPAEEISRAEVAENVFQMFSWISEN